MSKTLVEISRLIYENFFGQNAGETPRKIPLGTLGAIPENPLDEILERNSVRYHRKFRGEIGCNSEFRNTLRFSKKNPKKNYSNFGNISVGIWKNLREVLKKE